jgi:hypothetical protein
MQVLTSCISYTFIPINWMSILLTMKKPVTSTHRQWKKIHDI